MYTIRTYQNHDQSSVIHLHQSVLLDAGLFIDDPALDKDLYTIEASYAQAQGGAFMLATDAEGHLVAMGGLQSSAPGVAEIRRMRVAVPHQRQGIGQQLLEALMAQASQFAYQRVCFAAAEVQWQAQKLCLKNGFIPVRHGQRCGLKTIFYEKSLIR